MIPKISVVVCTYNRAEWLERAVQSLLGMETHNAFTYEIVIINNNSVDRTAEVINDIANSAKVPVRGVLETNPGVVHARNRGVSESNGDWIAFFDDDQLADRNWIYNLLVLAQEKQCRCVGGAVVLSLPAGISRDLSPVCRMLLGETVGMPEVQLYNPRQTPGAGNLMVHRTVFGDIGVFDEAFNSRGEDTDLFLRMHAANIDAWYAPKAIVHHVIPAERLAPSYLLRLAQIMSHGMAKDECKVVGKRVYPLYWLARLAQAGLVVFPRYCWALVSNHKENQIGWKCRLQISKHYLLEGLPLLLPHG